MRVRQFDTSAAPKGSVQLGPVGDRHEREADRLAALAMRPDARPERAGGGSVDSSVAQGVRAAGGAGRPAPAAIRRRMERVLGADLGAVRVHADARSDGLTAALGARAFTVGADVFVRRSAYRPGSAHGDALLAHELAHTVQPGAAGVIRRAPTVASMDRAWSKMSERVTGLAFVDFIERVRKAGAEGVWDGSASGFTWADFLAVGSTEGGKKFIAGKWRDTPGKAWGEDQVIHGQHEWIETSQVPYVIRHAQKGPNLVGWLMALDMLRIPTKEVIFEPEDVLETGFDERVAEMNANPTNFTASSTELLGGHVGSMYGTRLASDTKKRKQQHTYRSMTAYAGLFHNQMVDVMKAHLSAQKDDLMGFLNAIIAFQEQHTWSGEVSGLELAKAKQIANDIREQSVARAGLFGGFGDFSEIQQFAREAKARNTEMMSNRVNAIVQHTSSLGFATSGYLSNKPSEDVYVTDEAGMTVEKYDKAAEDEESAETAMEEDTEQETPFTVATRGAPQVAKAPAELEELDPKIIESYGVAVFEAQKTLETRLGQINTEINDMFTKAHAKEKGGLAAVAEANRKAAAEAIDKKYWRIRESIKALIANHNAARQLLDAGLHTQETKQTTRSALEALYAKYCAEATQLLDNYVAAVQRLLAG